MVILNNSSIAQQAAKARSYVNGQLIRQGKQSLRVLMVTARYLPYVGGTEIHIYEVARRLAADGHDVTVLTTDISGQLPPSQTIDGVHIRRVCAWPKNSDYYFAPSLYREIVNSHWDLVHCQGWHTLVAPIAMLAARRSNTPYVVTFHSGGHSLRWRNGVRPLQRALLRPLLAGADRLIGVSAWEEAFFRGKLRLPKEKFAVIPNGAHLPTPKQPIRKSNDQTLILSIGRLERYKGHHRVIEAFAKIASHHPNAQLRIIGSGPNQHSFQQLAERLGVAAQTHIGAIDGADREEMASVLAGADLFILMSDYESQGISVMEALSLGRPVLVAGNTALQEVVDKGLARAVPLAVSATDLALAIDEQLQRPLIPSNVDLPTWEACYDQLLALYCDVVHARADARRPQAATSQSSG